MKCHFCGKEIDEGSVFCGYCGKKLPTVKYCVKCGKEIGPDDLFCGYCGASQNINDDTCDVSSQNETQLESPKPITTSTEERAEDNEQALTIEQDQKECTASVESVKDDIDSPANNQSYSSLILFLVIATVMMIGGVVYLLTNDSAKKKHLLSEKESKEVIVKLASIIKNYDQISSISDGLIGVKKNGRRGFINFKGEEVIPCEYDWASVFSEGLAAVERDGKYGFIDTKGEEVIPCEYDWTYDFSEGLAPIKRGDKHGFINTKGEEVIPCKYDDTSVFSEGLAPIRRGDKYGFIDTKGEEVIPCKYDWASDFSEGLAPIKRGGKYGFIDTKGEEVIPCEYDWASVFSEGLARKVRGDNYGFINTKGEEVIPCKYDCTNDFSEGFAPVQQNGKWGFINTKGEEVIPCKYDWASVFSEGFAVVHKDGKDGLIDRFGNSTFDKERRVIVRFKQEENDAYAYRGYITKLESNYPKPKVIYYDSNRYVISGMITIPDSEYWSLDRVDVNYFVLNGKTFVDTDKSHIAIFVQEGKDLKLIEEPQGFGAGKIRVGLHTLDYGTYEFEFVAYFRSDVASKLQEEKMYQFDGKQKRLSPEFVDEKTIFDYLNILYFHNKENRIIMSVREDKCMYYNGICVSKPLVLKDFNETDAWFECQPNDNRDETIQLHFSHSVDGKTITFEVGEKQFKGEKDYSKIKETDTYPKKSNRTYTPNSSSSNSRRETCSYCGGVGQAVVPGVGYMLCPSCHGTGFLKDGKSVL